MIKPGGGALHPVSESAKMGGNRSHPFTRSAPLPVRSCFKVGLVYNVQREANLTVMWLKLRRGCDEY